MHPSILWQYETQARNTDKIRQFSTRHFKSDINFYQLQRSIVFQWFIKSKSVNCITKVNTNLENEMKSDVFPCDIFKSGYKKKFKKIKYGNDLTKSWSAAEHIRRRLGNTSTSSHVRFDI